MSLLLEGTITQLPLVLVSLLCYVLYNRGNSIFLFAFLSGLILDVFSIRFLGQTSIFFLSYIFIVLLYQRKYEIFSFPFVFVAGFLGSFIYLLINHSDHIFILSFVVAIIGGMFHGLARLLMPLINRDKGLHYTL